MRHGRELYPCSPIIYPDHVIHLDSDKWTRYAPSLDPQWVADFCARRPQALLTGSVVRQVAAGVINELIPGDGMFWRRVCILGNGPNDLDVLYERRHLPLIGQPRQSRTDPRLATVKFTTDNLKVDILGWLNTDATSTKAKIIQWCTQHCPIVPWTLCATILRDGDMLLFDPCRMLRQNFHPRQDLIPFIGPTELGDPGAFFRMVRNCLPIFWIQSESEYDLNEWIAYNLTFAPGMANPSLNQAVSVLEMLDKVVNTPATKIDELYFINHLFASGVIRILAECAIEVYEKTRNSKPVELVYSLVYLFLRHLDNEKFADMLFTDKVYGGRISTSLGKMLRSLYALIQFGWRTDPNTILVSQEDLVTQRNEDYFKYLDEKI